MRRAFVLLVAVSLLAGCGGAPDRAEFARLQDEVDSAARIVAITVSEALTATLPAGTSLGTGRSARCRGGAAYSIETAVTHAPMDAAISLRQVAKELRREGYAASVISGDGLVRADVGDTLAEVDATGQAEQPTRHRIVVTTGCVDVGTSLAEQLVKEPGRDVRR